MGPADRCVPYPEVRWTTRSGTPGPTTRTPSPASPRRHSPGVTTSWMRSTSGWANPTAGFWLPSTRTTPRLPWVVECSSPTPSSGSRVPGSIPTGGARVSPRRSTTPSRRGPASTGCRCPGWPSRIGTRRRGGRWNGSGCDRSGPGWSPSATSPEAPPRPPATEDAARPHAIGWWRRCRPRRPLPSWHGRPVCSGRRPVSWWRSAGPGGVSP